MTFLVRLPADHYPADALDGLAPGPGFHLGTARAAAWAAQLAYEDEPDKLAAIARAWGASLVAFSPTTATALPMPQTRGIVLRRDGTALLAFAGTDPLVLANWLTDFLFFVNDDGIHRGFLAALAVAGIPPLLAELDQLSGIDLAAVLPPEQAARIVATVAVVKVSAVAVVKVSALVAQRRARAAGGVP
ncbi:hypothetical protein [Rhodoplanes roseus]|uniref:Uncharacterized protein n=1 Tax=Rhodoplanes roseus TaxID=29409 RepID=A0A327KYQ7_9BRAD|nr:hypothetical protein [Rhodoplanes roseus]RAI43959.1 hypothetical protein CH341_11600 [Rhodoplanes roseus]